MDPRRLNVNRVVHHLEAHCWAPVVLSRELYTAIGPSAERAPLVCYIGFVVLCIIHLE